MKKLLVFVFLFSTLTNIQAQSDETIQAKSFQLSLSEAPEIKLPAFELTVAELADAKDMKNGELPKFSRSIYTNISLANSGEWTDLNNGDRIWRLKVTSAKALALVPLFDKLYLPEGSSLHFYMPKHEEVLGAFTHNNTVEQRAFCPGYIHGESCVIEYYEPAAQKGKGILSLNEIGHAYRWITPLHKNASSADASGSCEVNVACTEATNWADQVRSVARILVVANGGQGFCSGALVNNTRQDCTPYFLSAQHCSEGTTTAQYAQWVFYFNYQASACNGTTGPQNKTVTGCTKIADSNDNGGDTGSDFLLLLLNSAPSSTYNVYYAGWNATGTASPSGVCIHHPDGDIKKISTYTQALTGTSWGGSVQNTHWNAKWAATTNGHGVTEPGSSGSPLFDNDGMIVGTLTGGDSYCNTPNNPDQFGKVSYGWVSNGSANNRRLKPWLDPDNTGTTSLAGTNTPCGSAVQNDAGIQSIEAPAGNICESSFAPLFVLRNFGGNVLHNVTINYQIDGNVYQYNWSGNLAAGGSTTITLSSVTLGVGNHTFNAETLLPNGVSDNNTANDGMTTSFVIIPATGALNLHLKTDSYGSETTWDLKNGNNNIVASGGPFGDVNNGEILNIPICLAPGCYTFAIHDSYGDGMSDGGNSNFQLTGVGGSPVYASLTQQNFGYDETHSFCVTSTGIIEKTSPSISILPNPSSGVFNFQFNSLEEKNLRVFNTVGELLFEQNQVTNAYTLNLASEPKGIYLLQVESKNGNTIQKLIVQ